MPRAPFPRGVPRPRGQKYVVGLYVAEAKIVTARRESVGTRHKTTKTFLVVECPDCGCLCETSSKIITNRLLDNRPYACRKCDHKKKLAKRGVLDADVVRLYDAGFTWRQLTSHFSITSPAIQKILKAHGRTGSRKGGIRPKWFGRESEIITDYLNHRMKVHAIHKKYGISCSCLRRLLAKRGVSYRRPASSKIAQAMKGNASCPSNNPNPVPTSPTS